MFAFLVGVLSTLLMAPQVDEWGTKVGLLSSLVVVCAARPILDRFAAGAALGGGRPRPVREAGRGREGRRERRWQRCADRGIVLVFLVLGAGHRGGRDAGARTVAANTADVLDRVPHQVDPATFPAITVDQDVSDWDHTIAGPGAQEILLTLAENLELENQALLRRDASILPAVDHGDRLAEMQRRLRDIGAGGSTVVTRYRFDAA